MIMYDLEADSSTDHEFSSLSSDSEISNPDEDSSLVYIPMYIRNYLNTVEHVPVDIMREVTKILDIDVKMQKNFQEIDMIKSHMKSSGSAGGKTEMKENLQVAKRKLQRILVLEEMKSSSVQTITTLIEHATSQLEEDQNRTLQLKLLDTDTPSPIYSNEEGGDEAPLPEEDNAGDEDSNSSKKFNKRISTSSKGRGRKSGGFTAGMRETKEEELETLLNNSCSSTSSRGMVRKKAGRKRRSDRKCSPNLLEIDPDEPRYCLCNEVSYGEMIGCDNNNCPIEWFHFRCVNLTAKPKGKWFCPNCTQDRKKNS